MITSVDATVLAATGADPLGSASRTFMAVLVTVTTADGVTGHGESIARGDGAQVRAAVRDELGPLAVGRNIHDVVSVHDVMLRHARASGTVSGA